MSDMSINSSVHLNCLKFCIYVNKDANLNWHITIIRTGIDSTGSRHDMIFANYLHTPDLCVGELYNMKYKHFRQKQLSKLVVIDISYCRSYYFYYGNVKVSGNWHVIVSRTIKSI